LALILQRIVEKLALAEREMSDKMICYRLREENAVVQLKESLRNSAWSRMVSAEEWSCRIAELEERVD
jgi:hypothetical protein